MSISEANRFARAPKSIQEREVSYPAEFHFRIILEPAAADVPALRSFLAAYRVTAELTSSQASAAGRYQAYSVSIAIRSQEELYAFDAAVKQVPGVRMVL